MRKPTQRAQLVKVESGDGERGGKRRDSVSLFPVSFFLPVPRENLKGKKLEGKNVKIKTSKNQKRRRTPRTRPTMPRFSRQPR